MKRTVWPLALLIAISAMTAGTVISAPTGAQVAPTARTIKPSDPGGGSQLRAEQAPIIETIKISGDQSGDKRFPGVAENANGDRLVIFMGHDSAYWYSFCKKGGSWSTPASIPGQPALSKFLGADVEVDSTGRFHCVWESPGSVAVYGSFFNGVWTTPFTLQNVGGRDWGVSIAVRSNDEVLIATSQIISPGYLTKDVFLHVKGKTESQFQAPKNLSNDRESSCQAWIAVDLNNHLWEVHKSDSPNNPNPTEDLLVIFLTHWDANNNAVGDWQLVSTNEGWSFWPQVAANSEGKVMTAWPHAQSGDYWSRIYNPATQTLSSQVPLKVGLSTNPWCQFWSKLVARGKDFYIAVLNPGRILFLLKFDEQTSRWNQVAQISDQSVQNFDLYSGSDRLLVAWGGTDSPSDIYLTAVEASTVPTPDPLLTIQAGAGGTTNPGPGSYRHEKDSQVVVTAAANTGYRFSGWTGDASGNTATITVTMDRNRTVKANFTSIPAKTLTIQTSAGGTTEPSPGTYQHDEGSKVNLKAIPNDGYRFANWSGDATGEAASITVTMDLNRTVKANFAFIPVPKPPLDPVLATELDASQTGKINTLAWRSNPENAGLELKEHWIYRKRANLPDSDFVKIGAVASGTLQYTDNGLPLNQKFAYVATTIPKDPYGKESGSSEAVTEINAFPPLAAACKTVANSSLFRTEKINVISWRPNPLNEPVTVAQYNIYRKKSGQSDSDFKLIGTVAGGVVEYEDRRLSFSESYVYVIRTIDSGGFESGNSNPAGE
ncbi:MAG: hypothetical protein NTU60_04000 [Candidatus Aminicenantes bacterium]|nr:hypothetical protein [Candidatus Aminicenantes bacterium]